VRWKKLGFVFGPDTTQGWSKTHAMVPTPLLLDERTLRVYFTACDADGRGRPGFVELDARDPRRIVRDAVGPLMDVGEPGAFDQDGVLACSLVPGDALRVYYVGFERGTSARYRLMTGLAESSDGGETFVRVRHTPVLDRTDAERLFRGGPFALREEGRHRLWYAAGSGWTRVGERDLPVYELRYAESADGISWPAEGAPVLQEAGADPDEHGFGRPWVVRDADVYRLFFSVRRKSLGAYRLGYAESPDGRRWRRRHDLGLDVSADGWDSEAVTYAAIVDAGGSRYCFYNGNGFGRAGFGVAVLESE